MPKRGTPWNRKAGASGKDMKDRLPRAAGLSLNALLPGAATPNSRVPSRARACTRPPGSRAREDAGRGGRFPLAAVVDDLPAFRPIAHTFKRNRRVDEISGQAQAASWKSSLTEAFRKNFGACHSRGVSIHPSPALQFTARWCLGRVLQGYRRVGGGADTCGHGVSDRYCEGE